MADRAQDLRDTRRVRARPQQIAPLFNNRARNGVEKPASGKDAIGHVRFAGLAKGILRGRFKPDGQTDPRMFGQVFDQQLTEIRAIAGDGHRQVQHNRGARIWIGQQPVATVQRVHIQRDLNLSARHAIIVLRGKALAHLAIGHPFDIPDKGHHGRLIGDQQNLPRAARGTTDFDLARVGDVEPDAICTRGGGGIGAGYGFAEANRGLITVNAQGDLTALGDGDGVGGDFIQI